VLLILSLVLYRCRNMLGPAVVGHGEWPAGIIALGLLWIAISLAVKHFEGNVNEDFSTLRNALITRIKCVLLLGNAPGTRDSLYGWSLLKYASGAIFFGMLVPSVRQSWLLRLSAALKRWLIGMGQKKAPFPAPTASEAPDHAASHQPAHAN
jgi:hypothetical protein